MSSVTDSEATRLSTRGQDLTEDVEKIALLNPSAQFINHMHVLLLK